jgi:Tfp pilus assembly protein PilP
MKRYKNLLNILAITFLLFFYGVMLASAEPLWFKIDQRDVIKAFVSPKSDISMIDPEPVVVVENMPYDPTNKVDPFANPLLVVKDKEEEKVPVVVVDVPDTELTRWTCTQLKLDGTVINHKFRWAAFLTPKGGRCYKGQVGDFIGKDGLKIVEINNGYVRATNDISVHEYKTAQ